LEMVKDGTLTPEQASEMIAALTTPTGDAPSQGAAATSASAADAARPSEAPHIEAPRAEASTRSDAGDETSRDDWRARGDRYDDERYEARDERRRHRHRHRNWGRYGYGSFDRVFDDLGDDIERAMGAGARTLRWALKSGLHLKGSEWAGESNSAVFSRADSPT